MKVKYNNNHKIIKNFICFEEVFLYKKKKSCIELVVIFKIELINLGGINRIRIE